MTTTPSIETESSIARIASTAAWSAALRRLGGGRRKLQQPLDQVALLGRQGLARQEVVILLRGGVAEDPGNAGVRVLDVVDGVLLAPLRGQVDIDLDRLVRPAID